jgi:hypothetical protein
MWPTWWNEEKEEQLKRDILIGIVTSKYVSARETQTKTVKEPFVYV